MVLKHNMGFLMAKNVLSNIHQLTPDEVDLEMESIGDMLKDI